MGDSIELGRDDDPSTKAGAMPWDGRMIALSSAKQNTSWIEREEEGPQHRWGDIPSEECGEVAALVDE